MGENMGRIKPRGRYLAISVPIALHKEISDFVKQSNYNSIAEFVKDAVREKMERAKHEVAPPTFKKKTRNNMVHPQFTTDEIKQLAFNIAKELIEKKVVK